MRRIICELIVIAGILYLGWDRPLQVRINQWWGTTSNAPVVQVQARPSHDGAWMWDSGRRTRLDTPVPHNRPATQGVGNSGSWMFDPNHRSPLDAPGQSPHP